MNVRPESNSNAKMTVRNLAFAYGGGSLVFENICADLINGSLLAILGQNGCGKSTLLTCLDGILRPQSGSILINETNLIDLSKTERARKIAYVEQHSHPGLLRVYDVLLLGRLPYGVSHPRIEDYEIVDQVIEAFGLASLAFRDIHELSGGEYQKVVIARAFVQQAHILLLDEPTNNLDLVNQKEVMEMVRKAADEQGIAAAVVIHDVNMALKYCDRFLVMKEGKILAYGDESIIDEMLVKQAFDVDVDVIHHLERKIIVVK